MKTLLFIGDVVGRCGSEFLSSKIYDLKKRFSADIIVINGENSALGNGITVSSANFLANSCGADVITTGNHCYKRRESLAIYKRDTVLRPANYPEGCVGKGVCVLDMGSFSIAVINLMGTVYMDALDNPFTTIEHILYGIDTPNIFVDFHAEATAEKKAMGFFLERRVTAVLGTHTHVQTSDETILGGHTGYITDVGMTGPEYSILGVAVKPALTKMRFKHPVKFFEADTPCFVNGVAVEFDEKVGKCTKIERIIER